MKTNLLEDEEIDYCQVIALESELLERVFALELKNYKPSVVPNSWLTAALEDNSLALANNSTSVVVKNLIDYIEKFIARLIEYLKKIFSNKRSKEVTAFIKSYSGPSAETYARGLLAYAKAKAKDNPEALKKLQALPAPSATPTLAEAEAAVEAATGSRSVDKEEVFIETRFTLLVKELGKTNLAIIDAMLTAEFAEHFKTASMETEKFTKQRIYHDNIQTHYEHSKEVIDQVKSCNEQISEDSHGTDNLEAWVLFTDRAIAKRSLQYVDTEVTLLYCSQYLKGFDPLINELKESPGPEAVEKLKNTQSTLANLVAFISLASRVDRAFTTASKGLYGM